MFTFNPNEKMAPLNSLFKIIELPKLPGAEELGKQAGETAGQISEKALAFVNDPTILAIGIVLVIVTIIILFFLKRIIINSILGIVCWIAIQYLFAIKFPFIPSLIVSIVFGPAGIGVMLLLRFLGML